MRFNRFILSVVAVLSLAACSTFEGVKKDVKDVNNWANGRPSRMEQSLGRVPTGYAGQHRQFALGNDRTFADAALSGEVVADDGAVSVYPVDGDVAPPPLPVYDSAPAFDAAPDMSYDVTSPVVYGDRVGQIFFAHGSSRLGSGDRRVIRDVVDGLTGAASPSVTVVGHASQRVDGVHDPVQRKVINFEMAQKRANAVTRALSDSGVNPGWVHAVSRGDEEPNAAPSGRGQESADRRVEIFVKQ